MLKKGDFAILHKPKDLNEAPTWVHKMDELIGEVVQVKDVSPRRGFKVVTIEENGFLYRDSWLEPVEIDVSKPVENEELQSFLDEFKGLR